MAVDTDIIAALKGFVDNRVFFDSAPFDTPKPYIVLTLIGGTPVTYLEAALPDKRNRIFQVNAWHTNRKNAVILGNQIEKALVESQTLLAAPQTNMAYRFDDVTNTKGTEQRFSLWLTN